VDKPITIYLPGGPEGPLHEDSMRRNPRASRERFTRYLPLGEFQRFRTSVAVIRDEEWNSREVVSMGTPEKVWAMLNAQHLDRELFFVLSLNVRQNLLGIEETAAGHVSGVNVHPREVFKTPIVLGASAVIVAHNHPSGDPEPSPQDLALTDRLLQAGRVIGIPVLDHVILGYNQFVSLHARGVCP